MNERIRLLSEQAHRSTADELAHLQRVHNRTYDLNESAAIYNEKFAELIVAECADVCYEHSFHAGGVDTAFGYGYKDCGDDIKRTFGVKS